MTSLKDATQKIRSDTAKDRDAGVEMYHEIFSNPNTFERICDQDKPQKRFNAIIVDLFGCVVKEKEQCKKKGGIENAMPSALKRFKSAADVVRIMMENGSRFYEKDVVKVCLAHLSQMIDHNSEILKPISVEYIRAIKALLLHTPHVQFLEPEQWEALATLFFNIVTGTKLKQSIREIQPDLWEPSEEGKDQESSSPSKRKTSTSLEVVDSMECLSLLMKSAQAPLIPNRLGVFSLAKYLTFINDFTGESSAHVSALVGLNHLLAQLEFNEREFVRAFATQTWSSLLALWNTRKDPLKEQLIITFRILVPALAYPTPFREGSPEEKAEIEKAPIRAAQLTELQELILEEGDSRNGCSSLGLSSFEFVPHHQAQDSSQVPPFTYRSFQGGRVLSANQALSWACLELAADVTAHLLKTPVTVSAAAQAQTTKSVGSSSRNGAVKQTQVAQTQVAATGSKKRTASVSSNLESQRNGSSSAVDSHRASKKRRVDSAGSEEGTLPIASTSILSRLSSDSRGSVTSASSIWSLQVILFLVERHWDVMSPMLRSTIVASLDRLISDDVSEVNSHAYIALASIVGAHEGSEDFEGTISSTWERIWNVAIKKHISGSSSRAAAHAASAILSRDLIPRELSLADLQTFLSGIDVTGPPFPYDSVCTFLGEAIQRLSRDAVYSSSKLEEHVLLWLSLSWSPIDGTAKAFSSSRTRIESCDPSDIVYLLAQICRLQRLPQKMSRTSMLLPTCDIVSRVVSEHELIPLREFFWEARLSRASKIQSTSTPLSFEKVNPRMMENIEKSCGALLEKGLQDFLFRWSGGQQHQSLTQKEADDLVKTCSAEQARLSLEMVSTTLLWNAILNLNYIRSDSREMNLNALASQLLAALSPVLAQPRWTAPSRVVILKGIESLLGLQSQLEASLIPSHALCEPGLRSGVPTSTLVSSNENRDEVKRKEREQKEVLLKLVWGIPELANSIQQLSRAASFSLNFVAGGSLEEEDAGEAMDLDDDGFGAVRSSASAFKSSSQEPRLRDLSFESRAVSASVEICLSILVDIPRLRKGVEDAESCDDVIQTILQQEEHVLVTIGPALLQAVTDSRLYLPQIDATEILSIIGNQMLAAYTYGRSEVAQLLTVTFVESTMNAWLHESNQDSDFSDDIQRVLSYLAENVGRKNARMSWRVRLRICHFFLRYLEMDPSQSFWCPANQDPISAQTPASVIVSRNGDPDMRSRFSAASMAAKLAETTLERGIEPETLHASVNTAMSMKEDLSFERVVTRILALGNSLVATSATRHDALIALIGIPMDYNGSDGNRFPSIYDSYVRSVLEAGALRLGYDGIPNMISQFALIIGCEWAQGEDTLLHLPYTSLGYATKKEGMRQLFKPFASAFFVADLQMKSVVTVLGILTQKSLGLQAVDPAILFTQECLPLIVAQLACYYGGVIVQQGSDNPPDIQKDWKAELGTLSKKLKSNKLKDNVNDLLPPISDQIIVSVLSLLTEQLEENQLPILDYLKASEESPEVAQVFEKMSGGIKSKQSKLFSHSSPKPAFLASSICEALRFLQAGDLEVFSDSTAYHVIRHMLSLIFSTRQLNEQLRLVESLKLYISLSYEAVRESRVLLSIILRGATALLGQVDLAEFAWGIVDWCLDSAGLLDGNLSALGASLLHCIQISMSYQSSSIKSQRKLGLSLEKRLASSLKVLLESESPRPAVFSALRVWPKQVPSDLKEIIGDSDLQELTTALESISTAKLSAAVLTRFRTALNSLPSEERHAFSSDTIWRLLEKLPERDSVAGEDQTRSSAELASVLAELFLLCEGHLRAPEVQTLGSIWDKAENRPRSSPGGNEGQQAGLIKQFLVECLIKAEAREGLVDSDPIFRCLRAILTSDVHMKQLSFWPHGMAEELTLLQAFRSPLAQAKLCSSQTLERQESVDRARSFDGWVSFFATYLCDIMANLLFSAPEEDGVIYAQVSPLVESDPNLSKKLCPSLLHALLLEGSLGEMDEHSRKISHYFTRVLDNDEADPKVWAAIIESILYLRNYQPPQGPLATLPLGPNKWLEVDFLKLSKRALECRQYTTSLLFIELCKEHEPVAYAERSAQVSSLLYEVYSNVDDPDGFYGIKNSDLKSSLLQRLHHEGEWSKAFELHASFFESATAVAQGSTSSTSSGLVNRSLHELGFNRLAATLGNVKGRGSGEDDIAFDVAWRTGSWDSIPGADYEPGTSQGLFSALRSLHRELDQSVADKEISRALVSELDGLRGLGIEASAAVRRVSSDLMCLNDARTWRTRVVTLKSAGEAIDRLKTVWPAISEGFDFENFERLIMVRQSILQSERQRYELDQIGDMADPITLDATRVERALLLRLSSGARSQGRLQNSINAVTLAQRLDDHLGSNNDSALVTEEFANVLWEQGHHAIAIQALTSLQSQFASPAAQSRAASDRNSRTPAVLATLGQWHATARSQPPRKIDHEYFQRANAMLSENSDHAARAHVCYRYAIFADEQYQSLCNLPEIAQLHVFISQRDREISEHERLGLKANNAHLKAAKDALQNDQRKVNEHNEAKQLFLEQSVQMYANALQHSDQYNDKVMRFVALWFENSDNKELNEKMPEILKTIPSYKLIVLTHQLSSRLSSVQGTRSPSSKFQSNLNALILRMCKDHPFHLLFTLYALKNGAPSGSSRASPSTSTSALERAAAAQSVWNTVQAVSLLQKQVRDVEMVCNASVEWAKVPPRELVPANGNKRDGKFAWTGRGYMLEAIVNVDVPVLTAPVRVSPSGNYDEKLAYVKIFKYQDGCSVAGGLHTPKISVCIGSDGKRYKQLFKSEDDLRQDAVFQQVFRLVNDLLQKDRRASQRLLKIRTYIVMPLGPQEGLLEFVGNTEAIGDPLMKMHRLHQPGIDIQALRGQMKAVDKLFSRKISVYKEICARLPPTFRHYFWNTQKLPSAWFAMRLNYTRSVATTSIVGHLLGLGDRHVSNILLDNSTGEVVHIDFGVAFDQGKLLPIPERVPFRLTRDFVDGMGISGVEGTFRRSCEETLRVLRESKDIILTVLEVLKYDPLFTWTSNPVQLNRIQSTDTTLSRSSTGRGRKSVEPSVEAAPAQGTAEIIAEQAINIIMTKLSPTLRIESTVNELIEQARDEDNLGGIFSGWNAIL